MKKTLLRKIFSLFAATFISVMAFLILFSSCKQPDTINNYYTVYKDAEEESNDFISEAIPVYNGKKSVDLPSGSMFVRFFDKNKYIPYVAVKYYLETFADVVVINESYSEHKYKYYSTKIAGKFFNLIVDAKNDTIFCPNWYCFGLPTAEENQNSDGMVSKVYGIMQTGSVFYMGEKSITFDLKKYGFKIYEATDDAYVPLFIMNQLFSCREYADYVFNGEAVYYADYNGDYKYKSFQSSSWYRDENGKIKERPQELIDASYNLLCFTHDYLYGHSGYYGFADTEGNGYANPEIVKEADALSFDELLNKYDPDVKKMLHSSSYVEYIIGLYSLFYYTYGDLHSNLMISNYFTLDSSDVSKESRAKIKSSNKAKKMYGLDGTPSLESIRKVSGKEEGLELLTGGKTAVIRFDNFTYSIDEWEKYYSSSPEPEPNPAEAVIADDTCGLVYKSFYALLNDNNYKNVKNVIIDISCNGGGMTASLSYFLLAIQGPYYQYAISDNTGLKETRYHSNADLNLDGKLDEKDLEYGKKIREKFKFAVLTSFQSFSCANYFPCSCAEAGIPIIGERSGGGSCDVRVAATADGFPCSYSNASRTVFADGTSTEYGAPVDIEMPCEDFYNDAKLNEVMNKLYGN